ncbi:hypothetical protein EC988_000800, partial [Linderina pennispora]
VINANESEDTYAVPILTLEMTFKLATTVSNPVYASLYGAGFGDGVQAFSTLHLEIGLGTFVILPSRLPSKDLVANICVAPQVMDGIMNRLWGDTAELGYRLIELVLIKNCWPYKLNP